jgi:hypothetical protein
MRLMELEKIKRHLKPTTRYLTKNTEFSVEDIEDIIELAWTAGYDFRVQEEELNKGASY